MSNLIYKGKKYNTRKETVPGSCEGCCFHATNTKSNNSCERKHDDSDIRNNEWLFFEEISCGDLYLEFIEMPTIGIKKKLEL